MYVHIIDRSDVNVDGENVALIIFLGMKRTRPLCCWVLGEGVSVGDGGRSSASPRDFNLCMKSCMK
jgi:hypothetical protein